MILTFANSGFGPNSTRGDWPPLELGPGGPLAQGPVGPVGPLVGLRPPLALFVGLRPLGPFGTVGLVGGGLRRLQSSTAKCNLMRPNAI